MAYSNSLDPKRKAKRLTMADDDSDDDPNENDNDSLSWYKPRACVMKFHGKVTEDRDAWLKDVKAAVVRERISMDGDGHRVAAKYLKGDAASWYESVFLREHKEAKAFTWQTFETAFKTQFYQETKQAKALRLANETAFTDLNSFINHFANVHKLYPKRDILETTCNFAYKLPPMYAPLREDLIQHMPRDWQELYVRAKAWKGRMPRRLA
ncbi:uncharacterized protein UTRI_05628 [Ustilago trichophora]|uniref:Retrotransposon gag domain-containing protein n=1 Tax=Ustilago trichophora TaxID=86804 RepID=A0A5C3EEH0_9BASI|nr:uncharacterized protein UTRI_05628 [Ustilago trichophora]